MRRTPSLAAIRPRVPAIALVLLVVLCAIAVGVGCSCVSDHPGHAVEQALAAISHVPAAPATVEVAWALVLLLGAGSLAAGMSVLRPRSRSPVELRRLLL